VEAVRAGRTFVTTGPLLTFAVNDSPPGAVVDVRGGATVRVRAEARSRGELDRLEIVANNRVVAEAAASGTPARATAEAEVSLPEGGWLVARCWGPLDEESGRGHAAQSSPIYVQAEGRRPAPDSDAVARLVESLEKMLEWVAHEGRFENDQQRQRLAALFEEARAALIARTTQ
jgi:hypothetical protein